VFVDLKKLEDERFCNVNIPEGIPQGVYESLWECITMELTQRLPAERRDTSLHAENVSGISNGEENIPPDPWSYWCSW